MSTLPSLTPRPLQVSLRPFARVHIPQPRSLHVTERGENHLHYSPGFPLITWACQPLCTSVLLSSCRCHRRRPARGCHRPPGLDFIILRFPLLLPPRPAPPPAFCPITSSQNVSLLRPQLVDHFYQSFGFPHPMHSQERRFFLRLVHRNNSRLKRGTGPGKSLEDWSQQT